MYRNHRIGVVIPVYNEAEFIGGVLDSLPVFVDRAYVVDDCSTDGSWEVIRRRATVSSTIALSTPDEEGTPEPQLVPIRHEENKGRGGAVKTGYAEALKDDMDVVAVMDGDGQMDPAYLDRIVDPVVDGIADYAKGNRLDKPEDREQISNWRLFGNALLTLLTRVASGYWGMTDPQNGYTAISAEALGLLELEELYDDYGFLNDVLVRLNVQGARIVDIPVRALYGDEGSGIRYKSFGSGPVAVAPSSVPVAADDLSCEQAPAGGAAVRSRGAGWRLRGLWRRLGRRGRTHVGCRHHCTHRVRCDHGARDGGRRDRPLV
jgi:glycosyltransferase involved in cell wall biosynthesis